MSIHPYIEQAIELLKAMISVPSFSRQEGNVAAMFEDFLKSTGINYYQRKGNNIWIRSKNFSDQLPVVLLNSHIDTVRPSSNWSKDPFSPYEEDGKIFGLGSNDAGASVVALLTVFRLLEEKQQPFNLIYSATAEEEISGDEGVASILEEIGPIDLGIVGEPTQMQMAVAEKGLMVIDGIVKGVSGHAARNEGVNAIYKALPIIEWFKNFQFPLVSDLLGPVKMTVTGIEAGTQHNVIPDECRFMVDVRVNEHYQNKELFHLISQNVNCELKARSFRLNSSFIPTDHPLVKRGETLGLRKFGSPTTSDQARMPFTTIKIGPGDSARSHTADEFICVQEIIEGVNTYYNLLKDLYIYPV